VLTTHGDDRSDPWYWLRDRDDPDVVAYLEAENSYTEEVMASTERLQQKLYEEIRARIQESDTSAPAPDGDFVYYSRTVEGLQYGIHCRRGRSDGAPETILLDENVLAEGHEFFSLGVSHVSLDHRLLAYSTDVEGDEAYVLRFRNLETGDDLPDEIPNTYYGGAWAPDNRTFFYTVLDDAKRPWQVWRHTLGTPVAGDALVHQEDDEAFHLSIDRTRSDAFLVMTAASMVTSESWILDAGDPSGAFRIVEPRRHDTEYQIEHHSGSFFVVTNAGGAVNFRLMAAPVSAPGQDNWREVIPHRDDVRLEAVEAFARHLAIYERAGGISRVRVMSLPSGDIHEVEQPEPVYTAAAGANLEFDTDVLRFHYTSLVTPHSAFDYHMKSRERSLVKRQPVLGGYDETRYVTERLWAPAADGTPVPISVLRRADALHAGPAATLLYGYGSYEVSIDPTFSSLRLSLVDRGVVFAIAHIRGGGEMGRQWYENGKFLTKGNTFGDFIACAEHLVREGYTAPDRLAIRGGSAGGMLMGAVVNARPELFRAVVAEVPFVDCLTTILDTSLPLTVIEWDEWGNPNDPEYYAYMKSYSPYDNVEPKEYPAMLVTAGLNDPRVSYWEPAKWVAKLRATKTDDNALLLKTEMGAGHMGPSGRYEVWRDEAFVYAFLLDELGITA
jgi:oligopeptidase B